MQSKVSDVKHGIIEIIRVTLLVLLLAVSTVSSFADMNLTLTPADGSKISDITNIVVRIQSTADVDRVEFKLDQKEAVVSKSVPYQFVWDTIKYTEGNHTLLITAFDTKGESKSVSAGFIIDNDLKTGAASYAAQAKTALDQGKPEDASRLIHRALKAEPGNLAASLLSGEIAAATSDWDSAVSALEKSIGLNSSQLALQRLSNYKIQQTLMPQNSAHLEEGFTAAIDYRRKAESLNIDQVRAKNLDNSAASCTSNGDALLQAGRYSDAAAEYAKAGNPLSVPTALTAREGLALTLDNRTEEVYSLFRSLYRAKMNDSAIDTVQGLALLRTGQFDAARMAITKALAENIPGAEIVSAYISLEESKKSLANGEALSAAQKLGDSGDSAYAVAISSTDAHIADRSLVSAITLSPFQTGPYLELATRQLLQKRPDKYDQAYQLIQLSLALEKDNLRAKLMRTLLLLDQNKVAVAETVLTDLAKMKVKTPDYFMTVAVYWNIKDNAEQTRLNMEAARKMDPAHFQFDLPPSPMVLLMHLNRKTHYRVDAFLTPASLFSK